MPQKIAQKNGVSIYYKVGLHIKGKFAMPLETVKLLLHVAASTEPIFGTNAQKLLYEEKRKICFCGSSLVSHISFVTV